MPIIDAYETTYGKLLNKGRLIKDIKDYVLTADNDVTYEFKNEDIKMAVLTGTYADEKDLPLFEHPLVFDGIRNDKYVAVDIRKYVRESNEDVLTTRDIVKDGAGYEFNILRGLLTVDFLNHDFGTMRQCYSGIAMSYAATIATLLNVYIKLNPDEIVALEIGCAYFASTLFVDEKDIIELSDNLMARVSNFRFSLPTTRTTVTKILENVQITSQDLEGLISVIKQVLPEEKATLINDTVLANLLSNAWFGPGGSETLVIGLEHMPTWVAVVYASLGHMSYKKARLTAIFNKYNKSIDAKDYVKEIQHYLKERGMSL